MFIDEAKIFVQSGNGGNGCLSMRREAHVPRGGPDGGDGGNGGNVVLVGSLDKQTLIDVKYKPHFRADNGGQGGSKKCHGRNASDIVLKVPVGTVIYKDSEKIADLIEENQRIIVVYGGKGGRGNAFFKTQRNPTPRTFQKGSPGIKATLILKIKLIADVGLIGYPNVGKSTLLSRISSAHPKIADYPFTTLVPNLGVVKLNAAGRLNSFVVADIPGLIAGAHQGKGLGDRFLKHIERTTLLVHMVDLFGQEDCTLEEKYHSINKELKLYSSILAKKHQIVVANKTDLPGAKERLRGFSSRIGKKVYPISAVTGEGIDKLVYEIEKKLVLYNMN